MSSYVLETRSCQCGCGGEFRVLPTSPQRYYAKSHEKIRHLDKVRQEINPLEIEEDEPEVE